MSHRSCIECYWHELRSGKSGSPGGNGNYCRKRNFFIVGIAKGICAGWMEIEEGWILEKNW